MSSTLVIAIIALPTFAQGLPDATAELRDSQGNVVGNADLTPIEPIWDLGC